MSNIATETFGLGVTLSTPLKNFKQIKAIDIDTKVEIIYINQKDASKKLNINKFTLARYIKNNKPYNNMLFSKIITE